MPFPNLFLATHPYWLVLKTLVNSFSQFTEERFHLHGPNIQLFQDLIEQYAVWYQLFFLQWIWFPHKHVNLNILLKPDHPNSNKQENKGLTCY